MPLMKNFKWSVAILGLAGAIFIGQTGGSVMAQGAAEGPSVVQETYRDWVVSCVTPQATEASTASARVCEMRQELRQAGGNQRILAVALQPQLDSAGASLTLVAPLGLLLSQSISIDLADVRMMEVPFLTCLPQGCIANAVLDIEMIDKLAGGTEAVVGMTGTDGQVLSAPVSLAGFNAGWNRLLTLGAE